MRAMLLLLLHFFLMAKHFHTVLQALLNYCQYDIVFRKVLQLLMKSIIHFTSALGGIPWKYYLSLLLAAGLVSIIIILCSETGKGD